MGIFSSIVDKIVSYAGTVTQSLETAQAAASPAPAGAGASPAAGGAPSSIQQVDIQSTLSRLASQNGGGGNWQSSIVDLLKLLNLDSSLDARKQLANELNVHAGADGTAEQNIALHKAVMQKIAENGGQVPASLRG